MEDQAIEPAAQPILSEGNPGMLAEDRGEIDRGTSINEPTDHAIAARAYELYQARGGTHGSDLDDWIQAEQELRGERPHGGADVGLADRGSSYGPENPGHGPID